MIASLAATLGARLRLLHGERGAGLVEYALLLALIALVCIGAVVFFGNTTSASFSSAASLVATP